MDKKQEQLDTVRAALEAEEKKGPAGVQNAIAVKLLVLVVALCMIMFLWNLASGVEVGTPLIIMAATVSGMNALVYVTDREARIESGRQLIVVAVVAALFAAAFVVLRLV